MARRLGGTLAVVASICALGPTVPSTEAATTVVLYEDSRYSDSYIEVRGDSGRSDLRVDLDRSPTKFLITDSRAVEVDDTYAGYGQECRNLTARRVRCESPAHSIVPVMARASADHVSVSPDVTTDTRLFGGGGGDALIGGSGTDYINGGRGDDVERGRRDIDLLGAVFPSLDPGRDRFFGGRGRDRIRANDRRRDKRIQCGKDGGVASIDRHRDPRPTKCVLENR